MIPQINLLSHFPQKWLPHKKCTTLDWGSLGVDRKFCLLMTGRSGSRHLVDLMAETNVLGWPGEFFNERQFTSLPQAAEADNFGNYLERIAADTQRGGTFGFKIDIWRLNAVQQLLDFPTIFSPQSTALFVMTRKAFLQQAYSFAVARATESWHNFSGSHKDREYEPSDRELWYELFLIAAAESQIELHLRRSGRNALRFTYEDLIADRQGMLLRICKHVGVEWSGTLNHQPTKRTSVQKIGYKGKERRLEDFQNKFGALLQELDSCRTSFDWNAMAGKLESEHGISVIRSVKRDAPPVTKVAPVPQTETSKTDVSPTLENGVSKPSIVKGLRGKRRRLFLHIGMHKTGTTSIQSALHTLSDQLFIRDYLYPMSCRHPREYRSHALLPHLLGVKVPDSGPMRLATDIDEESMLRTLRNEIDLSGLGNVILSSEDLWTVEASGIERLQQVFHDFDIFPIMFVRHPADFAQSLYQTMIRYGHIGRSDISQKKQFWQWLAKFNVLNIVEKWSPISQNKKVFLIDYDRIGGRSCEAFFDAVGLPANIPGLDSVKRENRSEPAVTTFLRQELLISGIDETTIERLIQQLAVAPVTEKQTLIPDDEFRKIAKNYAAQRQQIRTSSSVALLQPNAFEMVEGAPAPTYIGTMSGVVFAIGRALANLPR